MALNDAFFEAMRRRLREEVEGQRLRSSRGAENFLARRGLFGESTIAAQAFAGIGGAATSAIGQGEIDIQEREFQKQLAIFMHDLQKPSALEQAAGVLGQGAGAIAGFALGGPPGAVAGSQIGRSITGASGSSQDPFNTLGQSGQSRDLVGEAREKFRRRQQVQSGSGQFDVNSFFQRRL